MRWRPTLPELGTTFLTLTIAALGAGLAVVSAISRAADMEAAARDLLQAWRQT